MNSADAFWISRADVEALHEQREALKLALAVSERNHQTLQDALLSFYVCENCGLLGPIAAFNRDCTTGWTHGRLIKVKLLASLSGPQPAEGPNLLPPELGAWQAKNSERVRRESGPQPADAAHRREAHG